MRELFDLAKIVAFLLQILRGVGGDLQKQNVVPPRGNQRILPPFQLVSGDVQVVVVASAGRRRTENLQKMRGASTPGPVAGCGYGEKGTQG